MIILRRLALLRPTLLGGPQGGDHRHLSRALLPVAAALCLALLGAASLGARDAEAAFPGTNGPIACSGPLGPNPPAQGQSFLEIFTMNESGITDAEGNPTSQRRLTNNTNSDFNPRYSADGRQIAFIRDSNVWKMDADGGNEVQLTTGGRDSFVGGWSPDGSQIVFQRQVTAEGHQFANFEVFKMNADGTGQTNLSNNAGIPHPTLAGRFINNSDSQPSWSPDGTRIAFHSNRDGDSDIWLMDPNGGSLQNLTNDNPTEDSAPEFSPDGQQIAWQSDRGFVPVPTGQGRNLEIYRMNAVPGAPATRLTFNPYNPADVFGFRVSGFDLNPHWSPQGDRIVFHSGRAIEFGTSQWDVFTINSNTGEATERARRLTRRDFNDERCGWGILTHVLSVTKAGDGAGTVTTTPAGINCRPYRGDDCSDRFKHNAVVTLTASPISGHSRFAGFTGDVGGCSGTATTCTVTMNQARSVRATFTAIYPQPKPPAPKPASCPPGNSPGVKCKVLPGGGREITGTAGNDTIVGSTGNDLIRCGDGDDVVSGGPGDDTIYCGDGRDRVSGNAGNDRLFGEADNDRLFGNSGTDSISGGTGNDRADAGSGRDRLNGNRGDDILHGNSGNDSISGSFGRDRISGNSGNDRLSGNADNDRISGDSGRDRINGGSGRDRLSGASGNDSINARDRQRDSVRCGTGRDRVSADRRRGRDSVARECERVRRR